MRHFTDISDSYQGAELSFFLIEGEKDKALNRYVRGHMKSIEKHLTQRGVRYATFNFVSRSLFGSRSLKNLILRQYPTLGKEELNERIKSFRKEEKSKSRSEKIVKNLAEFEKASSLSLVREASLHPTPQIGAEKRGVLGSAPKGILGDLAPLVKGNEIEARRLSCRNGSHLLGNGSACLVENAVRIQREKTAKPIHVDPAACDQSLHADGKYALQPHSAEGRVGKGAL